MATKNQSASSSQNPKNKSRVKSEDTGIRDEPPPEAVNEAGAPRSFATADVDPSVAAMDAGNESFAVEDERNAAADAAPEEKTELSFYGSDMLRLKMPKTFEFAETVLDEWKNDGRFEALPLPNPLAQMVAQAGLRKAKDLEKKLEEKGVFQMAKMGLDYAKSKIQR